VPTFTLNMFNVTDRCPVCTGSAAAHYHGPQETGTPRMERRCFDCGFNWQENPVARIL
jgi:hypothetical protein